MSEVTKSPQWTLRLQKPARCVKPAAGCRRVPYVTICNLTPRAVLYDSDALRRSMQAREDEVPATPSVVRSNASIDFKYLADKSCIFAIW